MAQEASPSDVVIQTNDTFDSFLDKVQKETKKEVDDFLLRKTGTAKTTGFDPKGDLLKELTDALEDNNVVEVWKLIVKANETENSQTLEKLFEACKAIAEKENKKEESGWSFTCNWDAICSIVRCSEDGTEEETEMRSETEQKWIKVLSNPLYMSLEWLWRNNPNSQYTNGAILKESKSVDVIEAALDDAYLLEKIASYEHHYSREEYKQRAIEHEKFATDIVEQVNPSALKVLHEIMDIDGKGCLLTKEPHNFNQSLSLLKMAADKKRKQFVASPKSQFVLNEIVYRGWPNWQDQGIVKKALWFLLQLLFVALTCIFYIPVRLTRRWCCCSEKFEKGCWWKFRKFFEHPYSKFINHTMSYLVFLGFVFGSTWQEEFGTTATGLAWIDFVVLGFVAGLFLQEAMEAFRQGLFNYLSKWWNVVDTVIVFTFLLSYVIWLSAWGYYGDWKPRKAAFIVADTIYASGTVMAFFHLAHIFQVNSVLGPLQLSLYKMLKDVLKFLAIFLLLYIAFATGVAKIYSYYVASQIKLSQLDGSHHKLSHPYGKHEDAFLGVFWLLLGLVEEDKISVDDPAFRLTSIFGRIFMIAHVVCTVIVALNMLIAMMNNSFEKIMENSVVEWKFSRTRMWLEWIDKGNTIPVPFNLIYYIFYTFCRLFCPKCCCCNQSQNDEGQSSSQVQVNEGQDTTTCTLCPCCICSVEICSCTCGCKCCCACFAKICRNKCTCGCKCCAPEKHSMRKERMEGMTELVRRYLKARCEDKWKKLIANKH